MAACFLFGREEVYLEFTYRRPRYFASARVAVQAVLLGFPASNTIVFAKCMFAAVAVECTDHAVKAVGVGLLTIIVCCAWMLLQSRNFDIERARLAKLPWSSSSFP